MNLIHKKCKNRVVLDLKNAVRVLTPSFSVGFSGVSIGIVDFHALASPTPAFFCMECNKDIPVAKASEELLAQCGVCREYVEIAGAVTTEYSSCICAKCDAELAAGKSTNQRVMEFRKYMSLGSYQKKSLEVVLAQKVNI